MLSELIKKGGLNKCMTTTPATLATDETTNVSTVAKVATVTVANRSGKDFSDITPMTKEEETKIHSWLAYIEETDQEIIAEVLEKCRTDREARAYFIGRSDNEISEG